MKKVKADFVLRLDDLEREGKIRISPISKLANSFSCPKCGALISPENPERYVELKYDNSLGTLLRCKRCQARIELIWKTDVSKAFCENFRRKKT